MLQVVLTVDLNEAFDTGNTLLHMAVNTGNIKIAELLIEKGADVNAPNNCIDGATALHMAAITGNYYQV